LLLINALPLKLSVSQGTSISDQTSSFHRFSYGFLYSHLNSSQLPFTTEGIACSASYTAELSHCSFSPFTIYISLNVPQIPTVVSLFPVRFLVSSSSNSLLSPFPFEFSI